MKKILKRLATGFLAFATIVTALPTPAVHASETQYWTESAERAGYIEKVLSEIPHIYRQSCQRHFPSPQESGQSLRRHPRRANLC